MIKIVIMDKKSVNKTILLWTKNPDIIKFSKEIAEEYKLEIYNAECESDIIAIPGFINIIDSEKLNDNFLKGFNQYAKFLDTAEYSILVFGKRLINVPFYVKLLIAYINKPITKAYIRKLIFKAMNPKKAIKQEIFKKRINRIIHLYKKLDEGDIKIEDACIFYEISSRTLRRDIRVLRDSCDEEINFKKDRGYYIYS